MSTDHLTAKKLKELEGELSILKPGEKSQVLQYLEANGDTVLKKVSPIMACKTCSSGGFMRNENCLMVFCKATGTVIWQSNMNLPAPIVCDFRKARQSEENSSQDE